MDYLLATVALGLCLAWDRYLVYQERKVMECLVSEITRYIG